MPKKTSPTLSPPDGPTRCAFYRRVSTKGQVDQDLSLPEQRVLQQAHATRQGWAVVAEFEDAGISGKSAEARDAFLDMVDAARRREFDALLVWRKNRLFRNDDEADYYGWVLRKHGVRLVSLTESFVGGTGMGDRIAERVMDVVAAQKLLEISEDVRRSIRRLAEREGRQHGNVPYGYRRADWPPGEAPPGGRRYKGLEAHPEAAPWVRWLYERYVMDGATDASLARALNALGAVTAAASGVAPQSRPAAPGWGSSVVARILQNPVYLGRVRLGGESYAGGLHPPLVEQDLWDAAQAARARRGKGRTVGARALLVGGLALCPHCHAAGRSPGILRSRPKYYPRRGAPSPPGPDGGPPQPAVRAGQSYDCAARNRWMQERSQGRIDGGDGPPCPGYQITEERLLALLRAALTHLAAGAGPGDARRQAAEVQALESAMRRQAQRGAGGPQQRAAVEKELALIPRMEDNYRRQQAMDLMTLPQLAEALGGLTQKRDGLLAALKTMAEPPPPAGPVTSGEAVALLALLDSSNPHGAALTPEARRDRLRAVISHVVPSPDRTGITIYRCISTR